MREDRMVRLLKTVPAFQIDFGPEGQQPALTNPDNLPVQSSGWVVETVVSTSTTQSMIMSWEDTIDIAGISAAELSLINQGGAVTRCRPPTFDLDGTGTCLFATYVGVNPIRGTSVERAFYGNSLSVPSESQDWFLATSQTFTRDSTGAGYMVKISENNWGTGGIASSTKLFVKCFAFVTRSVPTIPPAAPGQQTQFGAFRTEIGSVNFPPTTIGMMAITAAMDATQTAAAIYRGNDLQQTFDN